MPALVLQGMLEGRPPEAYVPLVFVPPGGGEGVAELSVDCTDVTPSKAACQTCGSKYTPHEVKELLGPDAEKYDAAMLKETINSNPNLVSCPKCNNTFERLSAKPQDVNQKELVRYHPLSAAISLSNQRVQMAGHCRKRRWCTRATFAFHAANVAQSFAPHARLSPTTWALRASRCVVELPGDTCY